ncbi:hypothetical protein [Streptomonospora alba]|uniref:hypothetical protein n=1 Tax=Streptomonospora alba TaxID=183763 RepID=UPI0012EE9BBB|nr:hypothetical protein [Streptomonospora alba]
MDTSETARAPSGALVRRARAADASAVDEVRVAGWRMQAAPAAAPVLLWALRDDDAARAFYTRRGFAPDGAERDTERAGLARPREIRYRRPGRGER